MDFSELEGLGVFNNEVRSTAVDSRIQYLENAMEALRKELKEERSARIEAEGQVSVLRDYCEHLHERLFQVECERDLVYGDYSKLQEIKKVLGV